MRANGTRIILVFCVAVFAALLSGCSVMSLFKLGNRNYEETTAVWFSGSGGEENTETATQTAPDYMESEWTIAIPWESAYRPVRDNSEKDNQLISVYSEVEAYYNVSIRIRATQGLSDYLAASSSGIAYADVVGIRSYEIAPLVVAGSIYSVEDPVVLAAGFNYKDTTRWNNDVSGLVTWSGRQWTVQINSIYETPDFGSFILYDRAILAELEPDGILNLVRSGGWTNEKYSELASMAFKDENRDGKTDIYGTLMLDKMIALLANQGQLVAEQNGSFKNQIKTADNIKAIRTLSELCGMNGFNGTEADAVSLFSEGKAAFLWASSSVFSQYPELIDARGKFGILPIPNSSGTGFVSPVCSYRGYGFMTSNTKLDKSVAVFNELAKKFNADTLSSYKLKNKLDGDSQEMLDLIVQNKLFNSAAYDGAIAAVINEFVLNPVSEGSFGLEDIINNAALALDSVITQRNCENKAGGMNIR